MKQEEIDTLWYKALDESIKQGELYTRYHFAALVAAAEREACAKECEAFGQTTNLSRNVVMVEGDSHEDAVQRYLHRVKK